MRVFLSSSMVGSRDAASALVGGFAEAELAGVAEAELAGVTAVDDAVAVAVAVEERVTVAVVAAVAVAVAERVGGGGGGGGGGGVGVGVGAAVGVVVGGGGGVVVLPARTASRCCLSFSSLSRLIAAASWPNAGAESALNAERTTSDLHKNRFIGSPPFEGVRGLAV